MEHFFKGFFVAYAAYIGIYLERFKLIIKLRKIMQQNCNDWIAISRWW